MPKANHICKYSKCNLGPGGTPKVYYACSYCDRSESWRSMACCREHYTLYIEEVLANREKPTEEDMLPNRTDMTKDEVKDLKAKPVEDVIKETKEELKDYKDDQGNLDIMEAVEKVNKEIDGKDKRFKKK